MKKRLFTIKQASETLGVSIQTLRRWDAAGKLQAVRHPINNYRLYRKANIERLAERINTHEE